MEGLEGGNSTGEVYRSIIGPKSTKKRVTKHTEFRLPLLKYSRFKGK